MERFERSIEIDAPVERVFDLFSDFESFPRWMRRVKEVRRTGKRTTRWRADTALGIDVSWTAETTVFAPDHRIVWRAIEGDLETDGEAVFEELQRGTTLMRLVLGYATPAGRSGTEAAPFFGKLPAQQLEEDLERFRRIAERYGDADRRRPRGHDEAVPRALRRDDGASSEVSPSKRQSGTTAHLREQDDERPLWMREAAWPARRERSRPLGERRPEGPEPERRYDEAMREAGRGEIESARRCREEQQRREEVAREAKARRSAASFRERENQRGPDERQKEAWDSSEKVMRRGVDRLLDTEAESARYHRRRRDHDE